MYCSSFIDYMDARTYVHMYESMDMNDEEREKEKTLHQTWASSQPYHHGRRAQPGFHMIDGSFQVLV